MDPPGTRPSFPNAHAGAEARLIPKQNLPESLVNNPKISCVIGLIAEPSRLSDVRKNRINFINENRPSEYTKLEEIIQEVESSRKLFKKYNWPLIDVTRKSVEETAASVIRIYEIKKGLKK